MADENANTITASNTQSGGAKTPQEPQGAKDDANTQGKQNAGANANTDDVLDSHGQPGINKERHDREMAEKDAKIAELEAKLEEAVKTEEGRADVMKELAEVKASLADERVSHALEMAGCLNVKMAKAVLEDYSGDVSNLKEACPYLFKEMTSGKTGLPPAGSPTDTEERRKKARKAAGLKD